MKLLELTLAQASAAVGPLLAELRPIKPPVPIPWVWPWILGGGLLLALAVAVAVFLHYRNRRRQAPAPSAPAASPAEPPYEQARRALQDALTLLDQPGPFIMQISAVVRHYVAARFALPAPERTTDEFLAVLQRSAALASVQQTQLREFLERCDLVKFARDEPPPAALRTLHLAAVRFVKETRPLPPPPLATARVGVPRS